MRGVEREWVAVASGGRVGVFEFPKWKHYGNIRVRIWQPLRLFIVYCLPALWTVNNGTPSLWVMRPKMELKSKAGRASNIYQTPLNRCDPSKEP